MFRIVRWVWDDTGLVNVRLLALSLLPATCASFLFAIPSSAEFLPRAMGSGALGFAISLGIAGFVGVFGSVIEIALEEICERKADKRDHDPD